MNNRLNKKLNKALNMMTKEQNTLDELKLNKEDILFLRKNNYNIKSQFDFNKNDYVYYIVSGNDHAYTIITEEIPDKVAKLKILQLSDLHIGSSLFDEEFLRKLLKIAEKKKVDYVHIAGDLIDGHHMFRGHERELFYPTASEQVEKSVNILNDYNLKFIISKGNHDESFVKDGGINPLKIIEKNLNKNAPKCIYLDAYEGNIIHYGICFRLIHLAGMNSKSKTYKLQTYWNSYVSNEGNDIICGTKKYNIRSVQGGHFHNFTSFSINGIDFSMAASTKYDAGFVTRTGIKPVLGGILTEYEILNTQIISTTKKYYTNKNI